MKRPIVIVAMVYVAGLSAGPLVAIPPSVALVAIAFIAASQIVLLALQRPAIDALLFGAVFLIGVVQQHRIDGENRAARQLIAQLAAQPAVQIEGRLAGTERAFATRLTFRLDDCTVRTSGGQTARFPTAIQLACTGDAFRMIQSAPPLPGDLVIADGQLMRPPDLSNPDVFNYRAYLENNGIGATLAVRRGDEVRFQPPVAARSPAQWFRGAAERMRRWVETTMETALEPETAALARSVFLGQAERLDPDVRRDFMRCGLAHVFAVSGLNIVILIWAVDVFIRLFQIKFILRSAVLAAASLFFCALVGFQASVVRAAIMFGALLLVPVVRYKIEPLTALASSALAILAANPRALWQAGFQLSFMCMLSIILLKPPLDAWLLLDDERGSLRRKRIAGFLNRHVISATTMILAAQVGLVPFLAHYSHMIPFVGVTSNLLAAPLVWLITTTALLLLGAAAVVPAGVWLLGDALNLFCRLLLGLVHVWSGLPAVTLYAPAWPILATVLYYVILFGWGILPLEPSPFFEAKQRARLWLALAAAAALIVWTPEAVRSSPHELRATFLDVGQGDSCVLELPGGPVVLVDGGDSRERAGERIVAPFLDARGIDRLDAVIATHSDSDHIGGLPAVFDELDVRWLIEGPSAGDSQVHRRLLESAESERAGHDVVWAGDWIETPAGARIVFLHPRRGAVYSKSNDQSLAMMVDWRECEILIAGDIEQAGQRDLLASGTDLACDVFKVSHHGSALAASRAILDRARPRLAVISCGRDNAFGHPSPEVLDLLTSAGAAIARTDRDGAVSVRSDGESFVWRTEGKAD